MSGILHKKDYSEPDQSRRPSRKKRTGKSDASQTVWKLQLCQVFIEQQKSNRLDTKYIEELS